jgi:maleate isomerase
MADRSPVLGAIYPDDMWIDEDINQVLAEFRRFLCPEVRMLSVRTCIPMIDNNLENSIWEATNGDIEAAAGRLMRYQPDVFAYYCTTISFVRGVAGDQDIQHRVQEATGRPCTTTSTSIVNALHGLGIRRVATASPYLEDVNAALTRYLAECGITVVNSHPLRLPQDHSTVPSDTIRAAAEEADVPAAEAILIACTGQKTASFIADLERRLGKPVVTSNQATGWQALQMLGLTPVLPERGILFGA